MLRAVTVGDDRARGREAVRFVACSLVAGVVVNVLVTWGMGWWGVPLVTTSREHVVRVGEKTVWAYEHRSAIGTVWIWDSEWPRRIAIDHYERVHGRSSYVRTQPELPPLEYTSSELIPAWVTFADESRVPEPVGPNLMKLHPEMDVEVGWPLRTLSMAGGPSQEKRGGLRSVWMNSLSGIRCLPYTPRWPGFGVMSVVWGVVSGAAFVGGRRVVRAAVRRWRREAWECRGCGYDRRGLAEGRLVRSAGGHARDKDLGRWWHQTRRGGIVVDGRHARAWEGMRLVRFWVGGVGLWRGFGGVLWSLLRAGRRVSGSLVRGGGLVGPGGSWSGG